MKIVITLLAFGLLAGCANDGTMRLEARIPLGENGQYGTLIPSVAYLPPENFPNVIENPPTLNDK